MEQRGVLFFMGNKNQAHFIYKQFLLLGYLFAPRLKVEL